MSFHEVAVELIARHFVCWRFPACHDTIPARAQPWVFLAGLAGHKSDLMIFHKATGLVGQSLTPKARADSIYLSCASAHRKPPYYFCQ